MTMGHVIRLPAAQRPPTVNVVDSKEIRTPDAPILSRLIVTT
jgi:hypothetical protein